MPQGRRCRQGDVGYSEENLGNLRIPQIPHGGLPARAARVQRRVRCTERGMGWWGGGGATAVDGGGAAVGGAVAHRLATYSWEKRVRRMESIYE